MRKRNTKVVWMVVMLIHVLILSMATFGMQENNVWAAQKCGANATWELDYDTGVLTISGTGDMYDSPDFNILGDYINKVVINSGITSIGKDAFFTSNVSEITISNTVKSIGNRAFWGCDKLTELMLPASLVSIDDYAIENCPELRSIVVDEDNPYFSSEDGIFYNKDKSKLIVYPAGKNQDLFTIPDGVTSMGVCAFDYCKYLTVLCVPASVTKIEYSPFCGSEKLQQILVDENNLNYASVDGNLYNKQKTSLIRVAPGKAYTEFEVPIEMMSIEMGAFDGCNSITKITILNSECSINQDSNALPENAVIYGYTNSDAEKYAKNNEREFVSIGERESEKTTNNISSENSGNNVGENKNPKPNVTTGSSEKNVITKSAKVTKPSKVKGLKAKKLKKKSIKLTWKKVKGVSGYQVMYSAHKKFKKNKKVVKIKSSVTNKKIKGLKKKTYYFKIRAYKKVDGKTFYGDWSKVQKVKIKK